MTTTATPNTTIQRLVESKFNLFNVDITKAPVKKNGKKMSNWETKSYTELVAEHNYHSNLWGLRLGQQENGKCILSLDFDKYSKKTGEDCLETKKKLDEYLLKCSSDNGIYTSSTDGNMNVLVDYTNSPTIKKYIEKIEKCKFDHFGLEILLKGNQVIPPSQTTCKKTKTLGKPRAFKNPAEIFYIIENEGIM